MIVGKTENRKNVSVLINILNSTLTHFFMNAQKAHQNIIAKEQKSMRT